jgi:RNA polymerase subunit RPABC4/transcription elongation factor Spt4
VVTIMTEWYYQVAGETVGPVSWEQLQQKAGDGEIEEGTLVREGAEAAWNAASDVAGLFASELPTLATAEGPDEEGPDVRRSPLNLRPCSDCGAMVSKQASVCPQCGRAFHQSSFTARYGGEQPVVTFVLMCLLGVAFLFLSPLGVYWIALKLAPNVVQAGEAQDMAYTAFGLVILVLYVFAMLSCTLLGGAVGKPRHAYLTGCFLGLFFGPLGVFTAFAIDKRPECPQCASRLNGMAKECPNCHARLIWKVAPTWY